MTIEPYSISLARDRDLAALPGIELAAARLLEGHAPAAVLLEATARCDLEDAMAAGRLWVARLNDEAVGFAIAEMLGPGRPHLEEIDVHPDHGRRGIGAALVRTVCDWAARSGHAGVTLTTFRDVPWNMPFYARLGFEPIDQAELGPELADVLHEEAARGLDPTRRVAMRFRTRVA